MELDVHQGNDTSIKEVQNWALSTQTFKSREHYKELWKESKNKCPESWEKSTWMQSPKQGK